MNSSAANFRTAVNGAASGTLNLQLTNQTTINHVKTLETQNRKRRIDGNLESYSELVLKESISLFFLGFLGIQKEHRNRERKK